MLFALDSLARSTLVTIVPLQAYNLLGDKHSVVTLYFLVSVAGLTGSMLVPWMVRHIRHHGTLILGSCCMTVSALLLSQHSLPFFVAGLALQLFGAATVVICLNVYVLKVVPRQEFTRFEPVRIVFSGAAWVVGPYLGVRLGKDVAEWFPYIVAATVSFIQLAFFLHLRRQETPGAAEEIVKRASPIRFIRRFFRQPRLILAWLLSVTRAGWWGLFYNFGPIFLVANGLSEEMTGLIASIGSAGMLTVIFWGWVGRRIGIRNLLTVAYALAGFLTLLVAGTSDFPLIGACLLIGAAAATSIIDSSGNIPFLYAVRPRERSEMTTFYATYRDMSRLTFPGLYTLLLALFPFPVIFLAGGGIMISLSQCARKLPAGLGLERSRRRSLIQARYGR